jgi:hypothetical protein
MENTTYNGWTNYATWRINLEIFDCWSVDDVKSLTMDDEQLSDSDLAWQLKDYLEVALGDMSKDNLVLSYALAFISDVNWHEIANHLNNLYTEETL